MTESDLITHSAFVLAAGRGSRMMPITQNIPKPLVTVNNETLLRRTLDQLKIVGIKNITINLHYLGNKIEEELKDYEELKITYSKEDTLLDTGGGIKNALNTIPDDVFFITSGDGYLIDQRGNALQRMLKAWNPQKMDILLLLQPTSSMTLTTGIGDYDLKQNGMATRSHDKTGSHMFTSVRLVKKTIFSNCPEGAFSFLECMDQAEKEGQLYGIEHHGMWHHISTPQDLQTVNESLAK